MTPASRTRAAVCAAGLLPVLLLAPSARADVTPRADLPARLADSDPTDGRIDGDLDIAVGLGAAIGGSTGAVRGAAEARLRFVETAGVWVTYEDAFGGAATPTRAFASGVELRPLFLARWLTGSEFGVAWPDLALDSLALEIGACFEEPAPSPPSPPGQSFDHEPALQLALGVELPLLALASGPWLGFHAGGRWDGGELAGAASSGASGRSLFLAITLSYHQVIATHLVDLNDRAP